MRQIDTEMSSGIAWTLEEIIEFIERARGGAIRRTPWEELVEKVSWLTQGFPCALQTVGVGAKLGRARLLGATEQVTETKHLGPPPPEKCHSAGRCNWVGQPNAYLGVGTQLALSEINARIGDRVGLLHVKPTREMRFLRIGAIDLYRRTSGECDLDEGLKNDIRQIPMDRDGIRIYLLDAFISDVFSRKGDPDVYRITSAIGRMFFDDLPEIDGIIYDSVNHVRGACIAMRTSSFDTMQATEAQIIKVTADLGYGIYDFDEEIFADSFRNGVIEWQQRPS